jgi:hypothetical protein
MCKYYKSGLYMKMWSAYSRQSVNTYIVYIDRTRAFFLGGRRGTHTPKHFVNLMRESKSFKKLVFPLNQLQTCYGYLCDLCPLTAFIFSN